MTEPTTAEKLAALVRDFLDPDPCSLDHHGYCQAHGWQCGGPCPHGRAREVLAEYDAAPAAVPPPADRAALRERIAEALYEHLHPGSHWSDTSMPADWRPTYLEEADAVLAVLPAPVVGGDLIEQYLRFLRGLGPEPDLSDLAPDQREAVTGQFEIVRALADRDAELPPLDQDPVARRLGLLPAPVDRADVLREGADRYAKLADQNEAYDREQGDLDATARLQHETVRDVATGLRRMADEAQQSASSGALELAGPEFKANAESLNSVVEAQQGRAAALSDAERTMLTYALDQAQEHIWSRDGFTDEDQAAVTSLRRLAADATPQHAARTQCPDREPLIDVQCTKEAGHDVHSDRPGRIWYPVADDTDLTETDVDRMMAAGVPVQIVTAPPATSAAAMEPRPDTTQGEARTVAYRSADGRRLLCTGHAPEWVAILCGAFHPVTAEDLPDGGVCTALVENDEPCGVDVLIPQEADRG